MAQAVPRPGRGGPTFFPYARGGRTSEGIGLGSGADIEILSVPLPQISVFSRWNVPFPLPWRPPPANRKLSWSVIAGPDAQMMLPSEWNVSDASFAGVPGSSNTMSIVKTVGRAALAADVMSRAPSTPAVTPSRRTRNTCIPPVRPDR